jgi:hypothetical protein
MYVCMYASISYIHTYIYTCIYIHASILGWKHENARMHVISRATWFKLQPPRQVVRMKVFVSTYTQAHLHTHMDIGPCIKSKRICALVCVDTDIYTPPSQRLLFKCMSVSIYMFIYTHLTLLSSGWDFDTFVASVYQVYTCAAMCSYICMCCYVLIYMHVLLCAHIYIYMCCYVLIYIYMWCYVLIYMHVLLCAHIYIHVLLCAHIYTCAAMCSYICMFCYVLMLICQLLCVCPHVMTHVYTYTYTCIYIHVLLCPHVNMSIVRILARISGVYVSRGTFLVLLCAHVNMSIVRISARISGVYVS